MRTWSREVVVGCVACLGLVLAGCGGDAVKPPSYKLESVTGKVTKGGQPLKDVMVTFNPEDPKVPGFTGKTNEQGAYELMGPTGGKGAAAGKYKVTLSASSGAPESYSAAPGGGPPAPAAPPFPKEYSEVATTPKTAEVTAGSKNVVDIAL